MPIAVESIYYLHSLFHMLFPQKPIYKYKETALTNSKSQNTKILRNQHQARTEQLG